jgi:signal transduction histidine kinase
MPWRSSLAVRLLLPAALVVLVATLATLQYHWLGQVSEAERDRLQTSLRQSAKDMADDFDRELLRLYTTLQNDSTSMKAHDWAPFATRFEAWRETAKYPQVVRAVYFLDSDAADAPLWTYRPETRTFEITPWPASLAPVQQRFADARQRTAQVDKETHPVLSAGDPLMSSVPALVISLPIVQSWQGFNFKDLGQVKFESSYVVTELDREYLRSTLLPALVTRYFPEHEADNYRFAVIDPGDPAHPIYARGLAPGATLDPDHADWTVSMFGMRFDLAQFVTREQSVSGVRTGQPGTTLDRTLGVVMGASPNVAMRLERPTPTPPPPPTPVPPNGRTTTGSVSIYVQSTNAGTGNADFLKIAPRPTSAWRLVLQHTAGSLDAAVEHARRRNLWLSFSILGVLAAGVALIVGNAQRSQRLAAQQMDFVATVSHELRTPLTVIRSAAQNLSAGVVHDESQTRRYGDLIETEGRRLTEMVEQVLEYSGLSGNRQLPLARAIDPGDLVKDVVESCGSLFEAERIDPVVDVQRDLPLILADEGALRRALNNLLSNALKYGGDGQWIGVTVKRAGSRSKPEAQIAVSDRGRGIEPDDLAHVFEPFFRGRYALERQIHGSGLGLSLVARIAEAHGGRVTVSSTPGQGSTFTIHLPALPPDPAVQALPEPASDASV